MWLEPEDGVSLPRQGLWVHCRSSPSGSTAQKSQSSSIWPGRLSLSATKPSCDVSDSKSGLGAASKWQQALQVVHPCSMALCSKYWWHMPAYTWKILSLAGFWALQHSRRQCARTAFLHFWALQHGLAQAV